MPKTIKDKDTNSKLPMLVEGLVVSAISMGFSNTEAINYVEKIAGRKLRNNTVNRIKHDKEAEIKKLQQEFVGKEVAELTEKINIVLSAINEDKADKAKVHQLASAFGTLWDKRQIAMGQATHNVKHAGVIINKDLSEMDEEELENLLAQKATATTVESNKVDERKKNDIKRIKGKL